MCQCYPYIESLPTLNTNFNFIGDMVSEFRVFKEDEDEDGDHVYLYFLPLVIFFFTCSLP